MSLMGIASVALALGPGWTKGSLSRVEAMSHTTKNRDGYVGPATSTAAPLLACAESAEPLTFQVKGFVLGVVGI